MCPESITDWQSHLSMEASAAATLLGLVFVATSINLRQIVLTPSLPGRVVEAVVQFVQVLFISMLLTIPRQSARMLSIEILGVAVCS
jgi:modulator of FtsH protease